MPIREEHEEPSIAGALAVAGCLGLKAPASKSVLCESSRPYRLGAGQVARYCLEAAMAVWIVVMPFAVWTLMMGFVSGGTCVGIEETLEDSMCA